MGAVFVCAISGAQNLSLVKVQHIGRATLWTSGLAFSRFGNMRAKYFLTGISGGIGNAPSYHDPFRGPTDRLAVF